MTGKVQTVNGLNLFKINRTVPKTLWTAHLNYMAGNPAMPSRGNRDRNNDKQTKMMFNILLRKESRLEIEDYSATFF